MTNLIDSERIRREIAKKYESDPRGWRILWDVDTKGHHNYLITKDSRCWWLKEELINPYLSVGCGIRSHLESKLEDKFFSGNNLAPSFGFRPVPEDQLNKIIADIALGRDPQVPIREILGSEPRPWRELETPFLLHGPLHYAKQLTDVLSEGQRQLDDKLNLELERLVHRRYPQLRMSYT